MVFVKIDYLIRKGPFSRSKEWETALEEIKHSIGKVVWPPENDRFIIHPSKGKKRGQGNGVRPIKDAFIFSLQRFGWGVNERQNPLRIDAVKPLQNGEMFALEWETGNISSSHRAINRILLGHIQGILDGGALVVPTRELYQYLTDRVGNYAELEPYFDVWRSYPLEEGMLAIIAVEHDGISEDVPRIEKGTDGRALA